MAGRAFLGSVASRLRGGGARSGPAAGGFLTPPPTSQRRGYGFVVGNGMAAGVALGSLATKLALPTLAPPRRLLHVASGSTLPTSKLVFPAALCAKTRAGVAYVALFGSLIYMYGWVMPKMESLESNLKAWKNSNDKLTQAIEAVQLRLADEHVSTDVSHVQSSGQIGGDGSPMPLQGPRSTHRSSRRIQR
ncbi:unnamed protein product [Urochloa humidicola]